MSCQEDVGYEPPPPAKCPCKGCDGHLKMIGYNGFRTKVFLDCDTCGHCCHADLDRNEREYFKLRDLPGPDDPDFFRQMHFRGPLGYAPCTRSWPHEGPCAHALDD